MAAASVPEIFCIIGPTASGKSALAHALARRLQGEILCVDSMTVYRGMDIGTAKPTPAERAELPHHGLDLVDPTQAFSVSQFVAHADAVIADARARRVPVIAVGGTPMYFKALFEGLFEGPSADLELCESLSRRTTESLADEVARVDPAAAQRIDRNDQRRLIRALEVFRLTGKPITEHQREWGVQVRHAARWIGVTWPKEELNRRANARVKAMIASGWLAEVRALLATHGELSRTAMSATGYAQLIAHLRGEYSLEDAVEATKIATRQLASRQLKWFRRFPGVRWFQGELALESVVATIADREETRS